MRQRGLHALNGPRGASANTQRLRENQSPLHIIKLQQLAISCTCLANDGQITRLRHRRPLVSARRMPSRTRGSPFVCRLSTQFVPHAKRWVASPFGRGVCRFFVLFNSGTRGMKGVPLGGVKINTATWIQNETFVQPSGRCR